NPIRDNPSSHPAGTYNPLRPRPAPFCCLENNNSAGSAVRLSPLSWEKNLFFLRMNARTVYGAGGGNVSRTCFPAADGLECPARGRAGEPAARHAAAPSFGRCRGNMDRWQRLQELFEKASALDPAEVPGFLAREAPDPGLRAEVMALLRADSSREGL